MNEPITDATKATILRSFTAREVELADNRETAWRWTDGVILFPEARCPFCAATMQSNRVWKVSNIGFNLDGQYRLDPPVEGPVGQLVREPPEHPHVTGTAICRGTTESAQAALFLSINPGDCYWGSSSDVGRQRIKAWMLKVFNHWCGMESKVIGVQCNNCPLIYVEGDAPHDCMTVACLCGCGCYPAYYTNGPFCCRCSCPTCDCTARATAFRAGQGLETPVPPRQVCSHECCASCCGARSYCTNDVWCGECAQRIDSNPNNCECVDRDIDF